MCAISRFEASLGTDSMYSDGRASGGSSAAVSSASIKVQQQLQQYTLEGGQKESMLLSTNEVQQPCILAENNRVHLREQNLAGRRATDPDAAAP